MEQQQHQHQQRHHVSTPRPAWQLLSLQALVLLCIARRPNLRVRDIAAQVGVTDRTVTRIITELEDAGMVYRVRIGRCNHYLIDIEQCLDDRLAVDQTLGEFVRLLVGAAA